MIWSRKHGMSENVKISEKIINIIMKVIVKKCKRTGDPDANNKNI